MKKILYILLFILTLSFLAGCNESETPEPDDNGNDEILAGVVFESKSFTYDGNQKSIRATNVPVGIIPVYEGNYQTEVGEYTVTVKFFNDEGEFIGELTAVLTILPASGSEPDDQIDVSGVTFFSQSFTYDGTAKTIAVSNLPQGVTVSYEGETAIEVGTYTVVAKLYNSKNELLRELTATITIVAASGSEPDDPLDVSGVTFVSVQFTYDGTEKTIEVSNLPQNVTVEYEGGPAIEVGTYEITAKLYSADGELLRELTATITIAKKVDVQLPLV